MSSTETCEENTVNTEKSVSSDDPNIPVFGNKEKLLPAPYPRNPNRDSCPFSLRCDEIDDAALSISDPDLFAEAARGDRVLDPAANHCSLQHGFFEKPDGPFIRHFTEEDGCPAFRGLLNAGSTANVLCALTDVQLHDYCQLKFCEKGRRVYCPIWRAKGDNPEFAYV